MFINYDINAGLSINSYRKAGFTYGDIGDIAVALDPHGLSERSRIAVAEGDVGRGIVRVDLQKTALDTEAVVVTRVCKERDLVTQG